MLILAKSQINTVVRVTVFSVFHSWVDFDDRRQQQVIAKRAL